MVASAVRISEKADGFPLGTTLPDLISVIDFSNAPGPTLYSYRADGRLETISRPTSTDPILSEYGYDTAGRLTGISHSQDSVYLAEYGYILDDNGNREQVVITGSEVITGTETYVYDNLDRLISASYPGPITASFDYDKNGNRTEVQSSGITTTYQYDELGQLTDITDDAITPLDITIAYDNNGNRRTVTDNTGPSITREYTWDWANRLTLAEVNSVPTEYEYLGDSTRASLDDGTQTDFLYDRMGGLPQVIDDGTSAYLHDVIGNSASIDGTTDDATYPLSDALGSTRLLVDDEGAAIGDTNWDAWGNEQNTDGAQYEFGWTGEQYDESSDLTYLRARYYSPGTATFLSRDTVQPNAPGSGGYNPYSYANGNPTTFTDPSGHMMTRDQFGGSGVSGPLLYLAYVMECAMSGVCRYRQEYTKLAWEFGSSWQEKQKGCDPRSTALTARMAYRFAMTGVEAAVCPATTLSPRRAFAGDNGTDDLTDGAVPEPSEFCQLNDPPSASGLNQLGVGPSATYRTIDVHNTPGWITSVFLDRCTVSQMIADDSDSWAYTVGWVIGGTALCAGLAAILSWTGPLAFAFGIACTVGAYELQKFLETTDQGRNLRQDIADAFFNLGYRYGVAVTFDSIYQSASGNTKVSISVNQQDFAAGGAWSAYLNPCYFDPSVRVAVEVQGC